MSQRGTDPATERRRLRGSDDEGQDATGRLLEATFWVSAEAFFFGLPTLVWTTLFGDVAVTFVVVAALAALCLVGGVVRARGDARARRSDGDSADDAGWPPMTARLVAFRLGYYNVVLAGAVAVGLAFVTESVVGVAWTTDPLVGPAVVAALLVGSAGWLLPRAASVVAR
ncbi:hypothetical protein BRD15_13050 [Halobacteriales archaeon SW_6_65_15]|nr:MAG: hypothetical protein BRD15_13050 [Halobacteriales archaeon SW_6_65_15]